MAGDQGLDKFPNLSQKLAAPKKLSAFEKEKQAAEAKRQRALVEDAEALKAFQESFAGSDDDDEDELGVRRGRDGRGGPRSGPGSLGLAPIGPGTKRKRALDEAREADLARRDPYSRNSTMSSVPRRHAGPIVVTDDEDAEPELPRPTLQLSSLPPAIDADDVEHLLQGHVNIHSLQMLPAINDDPRTCRAIVVLDYETSNADIDSAMSALRGRYLGFGYELSISRHLTSSALFPEPSSFGNSTIPQPYGAEKPPERPTSLRNAPPPPEYRGFAPPDTYDSRRYDDEAEIEKQSLVNVRPPRDISTVRAIHTLADRLLSEPDPERAIELEAMLMAQPLVQKDERFAFLFDAKSPAGLYYRYVLWSDKTNKRGDQVQPIDEGYPVSWTSPQGETPFPDLTSLAEVVDHEDYVSSDDESDDDDGGPRFNEGREADKKFTNREKQHLRPLALARLVHLLSRLPRSNARLRYGDISRVSHFAISHAGHAAEEIADILLMNVTRPFSLNPTSKPGDSSAEDNYHDASTPESDNVMRNVRQEGDPSAAKLIGLYIVSDVLSGSSTAGARNAWKYRQLFEAAFKEQRIFYRLGRLDKDLQWGKMKAEQWKRKVGNILDMWESWNVFTHEVQKELKRSFYHPEPTWRERAAQQTQERAAKREAAVAAEKAKAEAQAKASHTPNNAQTLGTPGQEVMAVDDVDGQPMDDIDGEPMEDDIDGQPMDDFKGQSMEEGDPSKAPPHVPAVIEEVVKEVSGVSPTDPIAEIVNEPASAEQAMPKRRMRAEDMFADSDED